MKKIYPWMVCGALFGLMHAEVAIEAMSLKKPLDVKTPIDLLQKRVSKDVADFQFGLDSNFSAGYEQSYDTSISTKTQLVNFDLKFGYNVLPWVSMFTKLYLDTSAFPTNQYASSPYFTNRLANSRIALSSGYIVFGNLEKSPYYAYWGQTKLPYAQTYAPSEATPFSSRLFQVNQRVLSLGYNKAWGDLLNNAELFLFQGDTSSSRQPAIPTLGASWIGKLNLDQNSSLEFQSGFLSNIADSDGFQRITSNVAGSEPMAEFDYGESEVYGPTLTSFGYRYSESSGFATSKDFEKIYHKVPGASVALKIQLPAQVSLSTAFATALKSFDYRDLTYRNTGIAFSDTTPPLSHEGAHPSAWNMYILKEFMKDFELYTGYESSEQSFPLNVPKNRWVAGLNQKLNPFVKLSFEVRQEQNYPVTAQALGPARWDVRAENPVHVDGDSQLAAYSLIPSALNKGVEQKGQSYTSAVLALKVKF